MEWVQWQKLALYSDHCGVSAPDLLAVHVAAGMMDGQSVRESIEYLLGSNKNHWKTDFDEIDEIEETAELVI